MSSLSDDQSSEEFLGPYFTNLKVIGTGGSGAVYSAIDSKTDKRVALKRLNLHDQISCKAALRQLTVYKRLEHENLVRLEKVIGFDGQSLDNLNQENAKELSFLYLVQELVEADLHTILQSNGTLSDDYVKLFLYQLVRGLKYVHSANVVHRDVKPSNILVDPETLMLKLGDFGQTRVLDTDFDHNGYLTHCPSTLWYQAPEVTLDPQNYSNAVDMWGVGCVFAEMLSGKPLFEGRHELEQIQLILECVATNDEAKIHVKLPEELMKSFSECPEHSLASRFPNLDAKALDLLEKMLTFSPENRITAEEALSHPYLADYHFPSDEPISLSPLNIEYEVDDFCEDLLKDMILEECYSSEHNKLVVQRDLSNDDYNPDNVLSLKDIMNSDEEPLSSCDRSIDDSACNLDISSFKFHPELMDSSDDNQSVQDCLNLNELNFHSEKILLQNSRTLTENFTCKGNEKILSLDKAVTLGKRLSKEDLLHQEDEHCKTLKDHFLCDKNGLKTELTLSDCNPVEVGIASNNISGNTNKEESDVNAAEKEDPKNCKSQPEAGLSKVVMETFLGKDYQLNLGFSCKMNNAITGPFGLCYL